MNPSRLWALLHLWNESRGVVKEDLPEIDWVTWEKRFDALRDLLRAQLASTQGPEPVVD